MKLKSILIITLTVLSVSFKSQEAVTMENFTLKNGLKVYFIKYGKIEAVNISVIINSGRKNEAPGQQGFNSLTANLVLRGNKKYTEEQQMDKAFAVGAELRTSSNFDYTSIEGNFLSKDCETALDLMSAAVLQPSFDKEKVSQYISYLKDYNQPAKMDIANIASVYSNYVIYSLENPLGRSIYKKQLETITPEKLIEFHQFNYTPKNTRLIICGNFDNAKMKELLEKYFGAWQSTYGEVNGVSLDQPSIKKQECFFVNRAGATQCALQWNKTAPSVKDKDYIAFTIANQLFNQMLFKEIREKGGKTYSISSNHQTSQFSNLISIRCSVRSNEMYNTMALFDKTLQLFTQANFTQQEFENEITGFKTSIISMEYPEQVADFYNPLRFDFNTRKNTLQELSKLKMEDVQKVIKKYFTPTIYKLVVSGDESLIKDQLDKIPGLKKLTPADLEIKN